MPFVQPLNREADLIAILENYEERIGHFYWFIDALQKDGIQNAWDARINKNGKDWTCKIYYRKLTSGKDFVAIEDSGTYGLTGQIPQDASEVVAALRSNDPNERLSYFCSSNWSKKASDALGSRGRGKMIFIGASEDNMIYFDSLRSKDNIYVFGKTYLDENKSISVEIFSGEKAHSERARVFGDEVEALNKVGTRILIPHPKEEIINGFVFEKIVEYIQHTWWEILHKNNADITVENDGWSTKVDPSPWLPFDNAESTITEEYKDIPLNQDNLKIKNISFTYLGDKEVDELYEGISIQRSGMSIQHLDVTQLISDQIGRKIIGFVELDEKLETEMRQNEGPEHYSIMWTRTIPSKIKTIVKSSALEFAKKYNLIEGEKSKSDKNQREAEITVQKELNSIARQLGYSGLGEQAKKRKKHPRASDDPIRISVPDFETPSPTGRVNYGESLKGVYAIPVNTTNKAIKVLVKVFIEHNEDVFKYKNKGLIIEQEILLDNKTDLKIGWDELPIDDNFPAGRYTFKAKMIAMEDMRINENLEFKKADEIYRTVCETFYIEEEPKDTGAFKLERSDRDDKSRYFWWEPESRSWIIYWNGKHPSFQRVIDDEPLLQAELRKMSYLIAIAIFCSDDITLTEDNKKPKFFPIDELNDRKFEELLSIVLMKESKLIWDKFK